MSASISMPLWKKTDGDGNMCLSGKLSCDINVSIPVGPRVKLAVYIRPNKGKEHDNQPDYYGDFFIPQEQSR